VDKNIHAPKNQSQIFSIFLKPKQLLLMEDILHQLIGSLSHYLQDFIHSRWLFGISAINSIIKCSWPFRQKTIFPKTRKAWHKDFNERTVEVPKFVKEAMKDETRETGSSSVFHPLRV